MKTRNSFRILMVIVTATFLGGVGWGVWRGERQRREMRTATPLRVLCGEGWLSGPRLEAFTAQHHIPIQLYTFQRPSEMVAQLANVDGKIDLLCTSSFLIRSLAHAHWIKSGVYDRPALLDNVHVDFKHLPFDPKSEYGVPLFWNLYGYYGTRPTLGEPLKTLLRSGLVLYAEPLHLLDLLTQAGVHIEEYLEQETTKGFADGARAFLKTAARLEWPDSPSVDLLGKSEWAAVPLARVARQLNDTHHFLLPDEGGAIEVGLLAVGERAPHPDLALALMQDLVTPEAALETHARLKAGLVHRAFENVDTISPWLRPQALRRFPLTKLRFPDVNVEALPAFGKVFAEFASVHDAGHGVK